MFRSIHTQPESQGPWKPEFLPSIEKEEARDADSANERGYSRLHSEAR